MKNYFSELMKYLQREVKYERPLNTCRVNKTLCQDILFKLGQPYVQVGQLKFASKFFYDFNSLTYVDDSCLFVIDGVEALHKKYGGDYPLVKTRSLYLFLYTNYSDETEDYVSALADNPWLDNLSYGYHTRISQRASSVRSTVNHFYKDIQTDIIMYADVDRDTFTPRGVWGLDFIFSTKPNYVGSNPDTNVGAFKMKPLVEYKASFE